MNQSATLGLAGVVRASPTGAGGTASYARVVSDSWTMNAPAKNPRGRGGRSQTRP